MRADHLRARFDRRASSCRRDGAWLPGLAAVSLGIIVVLVLIARPTHELPSLPAAVALMPAAVVDRAAEESPAVTEPTPAPTRIASSSQRFTRPVRSARSPVVHVATRAAWYPWSLARVTVPASWGAGPRHVVVARDNHQSP